MVEKRSAEGAATTWFLSARTRVGTTGAPLTTAGGARPGNPRIRPAGGPPSSPGGHTGGGPLPAAALPLLQARLAALTRRYAVPGAQLAVHRRGTTVAIEVGELEQRTGRPMSRDSAVPLGSITKTLTAALALILVADGDLDLDAPVGEYLPELDGLGDEVTLRRLLSHTAGLASGPDSADVDGVPVRRYLADHCRAADLVLPPGTGFSYSNAGYVTVGALIAEATGMDWAESISAILLEPLGIVPAFAIDGGSTTGRPIATGHASGGGRARPVRQTLALVESATGALAGSATDLVRLGAALIQPAARGPLPAEQAAWMRTPEPAADPFGLADGWGLGLALFEHDGRRWVGHDGNGFGTACYLRADPVDGWVVAFTSNGTGGAALWRDLCAQLRMLGVPLGDAGADDVAAAPVVAVPWGCAGTYANGGVEFEVFARDGHAVLAVDDAPPVPMTFHDGLVFSVPDPESGRLVRGGRFRRDPGTGVIDALQIGGRVARRDRTAPIRRASMIA
ncbi:serine hydrolase domain-containing protein [Phytohabitans houttuyneae]|uniref:Serine hydrolase n=1 Tax=Phytohabitans houttuyneae TaxID=1076126 RepID=A0A6V8KSM3_9ACTN|nr:serine hydrolase [Phytohabitans houttuyneae]